MDTKLELAFWALPDDAVVYLSPSSTFPTAGVSKMNAPMTFFQNRNEAALMGRGKCAFCGYTHGCSFGHQNSTPLLCSAV